MEDENKCQTCGLEFTDADELETHALSHFGVRYVAKQFKCPHCSEGFVATSVDDLRQHIVSSHEKESRKPPYVLQIRFTSCFNQI